MNRSIPTIHILFPAASAEYFFLIPSQMVTMYTNDSTAKQSHALNKRFVDSSQPFMWTI
jgi:hypothetical protein